MDKKHLVLGIIDGTLFGEQVRYLYLFDTRAQAEEFVQRIYRRRTASRWEIITMPVETIVTNTIEQHLIEVDEHEDEREQDNA